MTTCGIISFRFSHFDGVSRVSDIWQKILTGFGFDTIKIAGGGEADRLIPGLDIGDSRPLSSGELQKALSDCELVLVENIGTIPLNLPASLQLLDLLAGRPAIMHHHDPPWQRHQHGHIRSLPRDDPAWQHVVINDFTKFQMEELGFSVTRIYNPVEISHTKSDRDSIRSMMGVAEDKLLVVHPTRAIRLKNIPGAIAFTEKIGGIYWLAGPPEENYSATLSNIFENATCRIIDNQALNFTESSQALYKAGDILIFPSFWESFGIPPIEAAFHKVLTVVGDYIIAEEMRRLGFSWFYPWETQKVVDFLKSKDANILENNRKIAEQNFSVEVIAKQIYKLLDNQKWLPK